MPEIRIVSPFPPYEYPRVWDRCQKFRNRVADDFAPQTLAAFVEYSLAQSRVAKTWGVIRDGRLGGFVTFQAINPVTGTSHVVFKRSFWGWSTTLPALELVYREVFAAGTNKILSLVFRDNDAIRSLAMRLGAREEGVFADHTVRGGRAIDMVALGLRREDFEQCRSLQPLSPASSGPSPVVSQAEARRPRPPAPRPAPPPGITSSAASTIS